MTKVLMTGATGYLGSLMRLYATPDVLIETLGRPELDLSHPHAAAEAVSARDFDVCLHLAADATTAHCEEQPELTHRINTESPIAMAKACQKLGRRFVFISTEQCFNASEDSAPYAEEADMRSVSRYGQQKAEADAWIQEHCKDYLIFRFSWMFGLPLPGVRTSPNILGNVLAAVRNKRPTAFRVHERRCMTYAQRLAEQLPQLLALPSGVYHLASDNPYTTYEAACLIAKKLGLQGEELEALILSDEETYAERPRDFRLCADKARAEGIELATFEEDLDRCLADFGLV